MNEKGNISRMRKTCSSIEIYFVRLQIKAIDLHRSQYDSPVAEGSPQKRVDASLTVTIGYLHIPSRNFINDTPVKEVSVLAILLEDDILLPISLRSRVYGGERLFTVLRCIRGRKGDKLFRFVRAPAAALEH